MIDVLGKKAGLLLGLTLIAGAHYTLPSLSGYAQVASALFVLGLGSAVLVTALNALVSDINLQERESIPSNRVNEWMIKGNFSSSAIELIL